MYLRATKVHLQFYVIIDSIHTIFSAVILIHTREEMQPSSTYYLATATSSKDALTHRPYSLSYRGSRQGVFGAQNSCHPINPLIFAVEMGARFRIKSNMDPALWNGHPWSPCGRGVQVLDPPHITRVTKSFIYMYEQALTCTVRTVRSFFCRKCK